jgi:hypothetical protein
MTTVWNVNFTYDMESINICVITFSSKYKVKQAMEANKIVRSWGSHIV